MSMFANRLSKNWHKLKGWVGSAKVEAYRIYDRDIPEFQFIVDRYKDHFVVYDRTDEFLDQGKELLPQITSALRSEFKIADDKIIIKTRDRQKGLTQYEKLNDSGKAFVVQEGPAQFKVNLWDYLDTGLFLDHRPMRQRLFKESAGKDVLNLFCYTGSVSVCAALGGGRVTSVDMSATYLQWAMDNFKLNNLPTSAPHHFVQSDVLAWLKEAQGAQFDTIFLDPPTFSNSKRMEDTFEVERDQEFLVEHCMRLLKPSGVLYFSNNKRKFKLATSLQEKFQTQDISEATIPRDFHDQKIHHCFIVKHPPKA
jgi:23S rRNA (cytosine1962-C5)-methyltransferase